METNVCNKNTTYNKDRIRADEVNVNDKIYVDAAQVGYKGVMIQTTHGDIMNMVNERRKDCKMILPNVWKALKNKNIDAMYATQGEEWKNFCDDVVIYYACRFKVHGTLIPICKPVVQDDLD